MMSDERFKRKFLVSLHRKGERADVRILLDYDSTTADTFTKQVESVNKVFGTTYALENFTSWRSEDLLTEEEAAYMWGPECFLNEEFQASVTPVVGAIETIHNLMNDGYQFIIASDRPDSLYDVTRMWLNIRGLNSVKLIFTQHKHSLSLPDTDATLLTKLRVAEEYGTSMAIDDAPHHAEDLSQLDVINHVFLVDMPYNRHLIPHDKVFRCYGWRDVWNWIHQLNGTQYEGGPCPTIKTSGKVELISARRA